jgi:hypothetical protein
MTTATKTTVKNFFAGEHTTTWSEAVGLVTPRECGHKHRTEAGADKCAALHGPWITYATLSDGRVVKAVDVFRYVD